MVSINLTNVCVDFPIYNTQSRSLKKRLLQIAKGGRANLSNDGLIVIRALENLNLSVKNGERVGLIGKNGAGKSTLLRLFGGIYAPSQGTIHTDGKIGSLIDISLGIDAEATGRENIFVRASLLGMKKSEINKHLDDIIEFSELGSFIDVPVRTYSTGMHLRLAFAVSTIARPAILVMDEWLSVGDGDFQRKAEKRLEQVIQSSNILILASHSPDLIMKTCNRVLWLEEGKIRMDSDPRSVLNAYFSE